MIAQLPYDNKKYNPSFTGIIGVAEIDITPPVGIHTKNWGASDVHIGTGVHRNLVLSCVTFQTEKDAPPLVLLSADLGWWKNMDDENFVRSKILQELDLEEERLMFCLSHTHAGPSLCTADAHKEGGDMIEDYLIALQGKAVKVAREALSIAEPAVLSWHYGKCTLAANRDLYYPDQNRFVVGLNESTLADDTLLVGRVTSQNKITAVLVNYACHPTTLAWQNNLISPDYVGALRQLIKDETGATCLFLQGASGDLAPALQYTGDVNIADRHGRALGYSVLSTLETMNAPSAKLELTEVVESGAPLALWKEVGYKPSQVLVSRKVSVKYNLKELQPLQTIQDEFNITRDTVLRERLTRKMHIRKFLGEGATSDVKLWIWQLGDAIIVGHPNEAYSVFQQDLRQAFPDKALAVANVANGHIGYLPPANLYQNDIYSVWQTPFGEGSLEHLIFTAKQSIQDLLSYEL